MIQSRKTYWSKQNIDVAKNAFFARMKKPSHESEKTLVEDNGKLFGVYELLRPVLWVSDPDLLRNILSKDFHMFANRRVSCFSISPNLIFNFQFNLILIYFQSIHL